MIESSLFHNHNGHVNWMIIIKSIVLAIESTYLLIYIYCCRSWACMNNGMDSEEMTDQNQVLEHKFFRWEGDRWSRTATKPRFSYGVLKSVSWHRNFESTAASGAGIAGSEIAMGRWQQRYLGRRQTAQFCWVMMSSAWSSGLVTIAIWSWPSSSSWTVSVESRLPPPCVLDCLKIFPSQWWLIWDAHGGVPLHVQWLTLHKDGSQRPL